MPTLKIRTLVFAKHLRTEKHGWQHEHTKKRLACSSSNMTRCLGSRRAPLGPTLSLKQLFSVISIEMCDSKKPKKRPQEATCVFEELNVPLERHGFHVLFSLLITTNLRHEWTRVAPQRLTLTLSLQTFSSLPFQPQRLIAHVLSSLPTQRGE